MRHLKQKPAECLITAFAMVTHKPVRHYRAFFRKHGGMHYHEFFTSMVGTPNWHYAREQLIKSIGWRFVQYHIAPRYVLPAELSTRKVSASLLRGEGVLEFYNMGDGHAVAFKNGVIYDSCLDGPMTYKAWREVLRLRGWFRIDYWKAYYKPRKEKTCYNTVSETA